MLATPYPRPAMAGVARVLAIIALTAGALARAEPGRDDNVFAADLLAADEGILVPVMELKTGRTGRYRVTLPLLLTPDYDPRVGDLVIAVRAGSELRTVLPVDLPGDGRWQTVTLEFAVANARPQFSVRWQIGEAARQYRLQHQRAPEVGSAALTVTDEPDELGLELEGPGEDGTVKLASTAGWPCRLLAGRPEVMARPPLVVTDLATDRVRYRSGDDVTVQISVRNCSDSDRIAELALTEHRGLTETTPRLQRSVAVSAGQTVVVDQTFAATAAWGAALRASLTQDGETTTTSTYFSVHDDLWAVGIGHATPLMTGRHPQLDLLPQLRRKYSNWIDLFFWAPCDWSQLTSPLPQWWSGQADYEHHEANLQALIKGCHAEGISLAFYASCNPAGPFAWEVARLHPQWFHRNAFGSFAGVYNVEHLDHWNDPDWRNVDGKRMGETSWYAVKVNLRHPAALSYGIDQILASIARYDWDAVRFDGHYTIPGSDPLSTYNMRQLKERVWAEHPRFRFGFNYGRAPSWRTGITHEMREAMAGGGLYMQEGIRNWRYTSDQYSSWLHYATNELRIAKQIQQLGGYYHCIWSLGYGPRFAAERIYKLVYGLIAGGHPAYGSHEGVPGCPNWGAFMTRWSRLLWDRGLRSVAAAEAGVAVADDTIQWQPFVQELVLDAERKLVIVHLVNPPTDDRIAVGQIPAAHGSVQVSYSLGGDSVTSVQLLQPQAEPFSSALPLQTARDAVSVTVPEVRIWAAVVFEVRGRFEPAPMPPKFTAPVDEALVIAEQNTALEASSDVATDPNKPAAAQLSGAPNVQVWETDSGFSGHGVRTIAGDPDATGGLAQARDLGENPGTYPFLGRPYLGPVPPGRHRAVFRIKYEQAEPAVGQWYMRVHHNERDVDIAEAWLRTPASTESSALPILTLGEPGQFADYALPFELDRSALVNCDLWPSGRTQGNYRLLLDHIRIETVARFADRDVTAPAIAKPDNLRTPQGATPARGLLIRGLFWQHYHLDTALSLPLVSRYALPDTAAELYDFDLLLMADVNVQGSSYEQRRLVHDWVHDGGRLVVFGGPETLGQGGMQDTFFADLLPFALGGPFEVVACEPPAAIRAGDVFVGNLAFRHDLAPLEGVEILATAGDAAVAARRAVGAGQVTAFLGNVLGQPPAPFWLSETWSALVLKLATQ